LPSVVVPGRLDAGALARGRCVCTQWRRSMQLQDMDRLLEDIHSVADAPQRIQRLEDAQDWPAAVALLIESCNKLAREELANVRVQGVSHVCSWDPLCPILLRSGGRERCALDRGHAWVLNRSRLGLPVCPSA
jgi:hypothetical protein